MFLHVHLQLIQDFQFFINYLHLINFHFLQSCSLHYGSLEIVLIILENSHPKKPKFF